MEHKKDYQRPKVTVALFNNQIHFFVTVRILLILFLMYLYF